MAHTAQMYANLLWLKSSTCLTNRTRLKVKTVRMLFYLRPATPRTTRLSLVRVPVLSKQQISTFPANGILNGSVQKTSTKADKKGHYNVKTVNEPLLLHVQYVSVALYRSLNIYCMCSKTEAHRLTEFGEGDKRGVDCQRELYGEFWGDH